jgi:hypothetical protein
MTRAINNLYVLHNKANKNPKNKFADEQGTVQMMEKNGYQFASSNMRGNQQDQNQNLN